MPIKRHQLPVTITTVPRNTVAHVHHKEIDGILKDLKFCSRRLKAALDSFKDELRILERLYYKCKNQHRMALFFKRIPEMRRYCRRLSEMDILERVDLLRASFIGLEHTNDYKALRSSWSHVPEKPYVCLLTERLSACSTLVCKMRERLESAYYHFTLAMQTGAFVQLIILFVAISSRMSVLSSELEQALQLGVLTCDHLLAIIHPTRVHAMTPQQLLSYPLTPCPSYTDHDVQSEDMGRTISRCEPIDTSLVVEDLGAKLEPRLEVQVAPPLICPTNGTEADVSLTDLGLDGGPIIVQVKRATTKVVQKPRVRKTKKKRDEIDEIFGF